MEKAYQPEQHEEKISQKWQEARAFEAPSDPQNKSRFTVPLPPPNVTGQLHLGHAMMLIIEDIMCRYHRMNGDATLWIPGTDHAAIATETVVLKHLGITDRDKEISREKFLEACWEWTEKSHDTIVKQIQKMGASCDWTRERFTMDLGLSNAVNTIFCDLYQAGLLYRGERMVNWSVGAQSVLADDELVWEERNEPFYHIQCGEFVIGTVRPETKCADSPVVVHPEDPRYKHLIGTEFEYETYAGKRKFWVIGDEHVDPEMGTGAMTISTAHDAADFEIAQRHNLDYPQKIGFDGRMTEIAGPCAGLTVQEARKKSVEIMREKGLIVSEKKDYVHSVPLCYRTNTVVEPMISKQWFVDVEKEFEHPILKKKTSLKKLTADAVRGGDVKIIPERFEKIYFHWIDNLKDWCVSRQIWWGHRIPVWYDEKNPEKIELMQPQKLIFARHGESEGNVQNIYNPDDSPLTEKGKEQAEALGHQLQEKNIAMIIASPLPRAQQTAEIVSQKLGMAIETWDDLQEIDLGTLKGKEIGEKGECFREETVERMNNVYARAQKVWSKIQSLPPQAGVIVFVGHGHFLQALQAVYNGAIAANLQAHLERGHLKNGEYAEFTFMLPPAAENLKQDEDTLDTWFSSALWPFSTLGWPNTENPDFKNYFPTSVLETGHDIIFFWVARMIMFSLFATGKAPFETVYLHGLVCDEEGKKMSKSKGNGIDPLEMIDKYGTDALRMSMIVGTTPGNPVNLGEKKIEGYRNFINKLWNVARFILTTQEAEQTEENLEPQTLTEKWLLSQTQRLIQEVSEGIEQHKYGEVGQKLYEFTWSSLADWGIEASKADASPATPAILRSVLRMLLQLIHPYAPFVTEAIWADMQTKDHEILALTQWPQVEKKFLNPEAEKDFALLQEIITKIRSLRSEHGVPPAKKIAAHFTGKNLKVLQQNEELLLVLARLETLEYSEPTGETLTDRVSGTDIFLPLAGMIDPAQERERLTKELAEARKLFENLSARLQNASYVENAPAHLVAETKAQHQEVQERIAKLEKALEE